VEEHEKGNACRCSGRPSKMESPEKMPKEEWMEELGRSGGELNRRSVMAGMEVRHCELLSSRGWARAGENLFPRDR
jgi:hypothetical protein